VIGLLRSAEELYRNPNLDVRAERTSRTGTSLTSMVIAFDTPATFIKPVDVEPVAAVPEFVGAAEPDVIGPEFVGAALAIPVMDDGLYGRLKPEPDVTVVITEARIVLVLSKRAAV